MGNDLELLRPIDEEMIHCIGELHLAVQNLLGFVAQGLPLGPYPPAIRVSFEQATKVERVLARVRAMYGING